VGEYFGHALNVVDLNKDGLDDIVVGSPLYSDFERKQPEIGRIYIYYQEPGTERFARGLFSPSFSESFARPRTENLRLFKAVATLCFRKTRKLVSIATAQLVAV